MNSLERDFLTYVNRLKDLIKNTEDQSKAHLAEEWTFKLLLNSTQPDLRNYILYYVIQQFTSGTFRPWFNKEHLKSPLSDIAKEINQDLTPSSRNETMRSNSIKDPVKSDGAGDTKSWGRVKFEQIQNWIETVNNESFQDNENGRNRVKCLYNSFQVQDSDTLSMPSIDFSGSMTTMTSDFEETPVVLYQKFILEQLPLLMTGSSSIPSFACIEKYQNEFKTYERLIFDQIMGWQVKTKELRQEIERQKSRINELENKVEPKKQEVVDKCIKTVEKCVAVDEEYLQRLKEKYETTKQEYDGYKKDVGQYMKNVGKKSMAIKKLVEESRSELVKAESQKFDKESDVLNKIETN